jgi:hypothetical protein
MTVGAPKIKDFAANPLWIGQLDRVSQSHLVCFGNL